MVSGKKTTFSKDGNVDEGHEVIVSAFPALREGYEILSTTEGRSRPGLLLGLEGIVDVKI